ncbi:GNAT family N-acetyltransferase [Kiloniella majae]|uniref:GNAT family N-acetyltransferase n=1 Tax=Kiloniella majae TaxID=1938558 RepID=UPI000A279883|nr:GNAT family N-acetyltransferase [Kiloniella majae]
MSDYRILVTEDPTDICQESWDEVAGNSLHTSYNWQRFWTEAQAPTWPRSRTAMVLVYHGNKMVGHCGAYRYPYPLPLPSCWQRRIARSLLWPLNPVNFHKHPVVHPQADPDEVIPLLLDGVDQLRRRWLAPTARFVLLDRERDQLLFRYLEGKGYVFSPGITDTHLEVKWSSFQDYLQGAMKSKHRNYLARCYRRAIEAGTSFEVLSDPAAHSEQIISLLRNVADHNRSETLYASNFLQAAEQHLGRENIVVICAKVKGRIVACTINYRDHDKITQKSLGMDYGLSQSLNLYRLIIAEGIKYAIKHKIKSVGCGFSQYEIKRRLGLEQIETTTAIKTWPSGLAGVFAYRSGAMKVTSETSSVSKAVSKAST